MLLLVLAQSTASKLCIKSHYQCASKKEAIRLNACTTSQPEKKKMAIWTLEVGTFERQNKLVIGHSNEAGLGGHLPVSGCHQANTCSCQMVFMAISVVIVLLMARLVHPHLAVIFSKFELHWGLGTDLTKHWSQNTLLRLDASECFDGATKRD